MRFLPGSGLVMVLQKHQHLFEIDTDRLLIRFMFSNMPLPETSRFNAIMLSLLRKLRHAAIFIHSGSGLGSGYKRMKYCMRGLIFAASTEEWLQILETPALAVVVRHSPKIFQKLQRPYLTSTLRTHERLATLRQHYQFVLHHFSPGLLREISSHSGRILSPLPADGSVNYDLRLNLSRLDKEGELAISLVNRENGAVLFFLTFSITRFTTGPTEITIGGLQGNRRANDKETIIAITRNWHGLRPKALLLFALHQLAAAWDVSTIRAVGDGTHIYRHWRKRKVLPSSYDEWWLEAGGRLAADGLFDLPPRFVPRDLASLKVNKRQMYRRRYLMLEEISAQMNASLAFRPYKPTPVRSAETHELSPLLVG